MTVTSTTSKALDKVIARGRIILKKDSWSLKEVADVVADPLPDLSESDDVVPFPAPPTAVVLTDEVKAALGALPIIFGVVNMDERRALSPEEILMAKTEQDVVREVLAVLGGRDEAIKEMIRHTFDVNAEESGVAVPKVVRASNGKIIVPATPRDAKGHYILASKDKPECLPITGTNQQYSSEFRAGTLTISGPDLDALYKDGKVSREDYLSMTVERRVFDETRAKKAITDKPERMGILRLISRRGAASTALNIRKVK
jgi:hypothetical protein